MVYDGYHKRVLKVELLLQLYRKQGSVLETENTLETKTLSQHKLLLLTTIITTEMDNGEEEGCKIMKIKNKEKGDKSPDDVTKLINERSVSFQYII